MKLPKCVLIFRSNHLQPILFGVNSIISRTNYCQQLRETQNVINVRSSRCPSLLLAHNVGCKAIVIDFPAFAYGSGPEPGVREKSLGVRLIFFTPILLLNIAIIY